MTWKLWYITDNDKPTMFVEADSFDEALSIARSQDKRYCCGQVVG